MLGCIYQLWDWLEAPPLFNAGTMDAKKLQQLQQAQHLQKKIPLAYQTNIADYRTTTHSPVFQQQQHGNYLLGHVTTAHQQQYQQSPTTTSSSGPLTPIDIQPHASKLLLKHQLQSSGSGGSSAHSSPYHQASTSSGYPTSSTGGTGGTDQLYQSPTERSYLAATGRINSAHYQATNLQLQYQQLQQAKLQAQLATQNEAAQNQQRQFALRQIINPPIAQGHYHMSQSSSMMSTLTQQQQQQQISKQQQQPQQRAPPSSLNLTNQFQPAAGPLKVTQQNTHKSNQHCHHQQQQQEQIYVQHQHQQLQMQLQHQEHLQQHHHALQQRSKSDLQKSQSKDQNPIYIQQNHSGTVVNQSVQTQISAVSRIASNPPQITKTPSSEESSSGKSPSHASLDRKKSGGGSNSNSQALKSPITKRPPNTAVTISGWLYKQGSDGLKVWRKRWFVLAEYCLYYYKGPEEEKVLGSILLPSYKVSACLPEDKIYRKYAFKCEHQNMRTYWLAAENVESMVQWVRGLSSATMMQASSSAGDSSEHPSGSSSLNHSGENSDSGIHTLQSQQSKMSGQGQVTPASDNGGATTSNSNGAPGGNGNGQPLYANAPPKPRRITDGGYSSPSPEHSIDNEALRQHQLHHQQQQQQQQQQTSRRSGIMSPTVQQMQQYQQQQLQQQSRSQHHVIYDTRTGNVSSAMRIPQPHQPNYPIESIESQYQQQQPTLTTDDYPQSPTAQYMDAQMEQQIMQLQQQRIAADDIYGERELYMQRLIQQRYPPHMSAYVSAAERRTPDAYGRSKNRVFSDYEDIYNLAAGCGNPSAQEALMQEAASYRRPLSPPIYESNKHVPSAISAARYTPNHLESSPGHNAAGSNINLRVRPTAAIVRPHSADFLEYEARAEAAEDAAVAATASMIKPDPVRAPRPKSSLDINRTPDSFYYSEENYAEKMRKSALYLQNPQAQPQQAGSYRTTSGSTDFLSPAASGMNTIGYENPYKITYKRNELLQDTLGNQAGHTSIPRMSRSQTMGNGSQIRSSSTHPHHSQSPPSQQQQQQPEQLQLGQSPTYQQKQTSQSSLLSSGLTTQQIIQQNEQFLRSASARLPKRSSTFDDESSSIANTPTTNTIVTSPSTGTMSPLTSTVVTGTPTTHLDGERKREESMKRLLEWKQRMLQSPLTRKGAQNALLSGTQSGQTTSSISALSKLGSNPNILLASTAVASGAHYPNTINVIIGGTAAASKITGGIQRSRSETHANAGPTAGYNSYSSDDEAGTIVKAPSGRSSLRAKSSKHGHNFCISPTIITTSSSIITSLITKTSTNTAQETQISTTSNFMSTGGHGLEKLNTTNNSCNDSTTLTIPKRTFANNKNNQQKQQNQQNLTKSDHTKTCFLTKSNDSTLTTKISQTTSQIPKVLKPILKTKIINVKPAPATSSPSTSFCHSDLEDSLDSSLTKTKLPKIPNAIAIPLNDKSSNLSSSPQISSYVPVYSTKTVVPARSLSISDQHVNFEELQAKNEALAKEAEQVDLIDEDSFKCINDISLKEKPIAENLNEISEPEALQDDEATPMLVGLKRFKEQEEKRQKLQLNFMEATTVDDDDVVTPTQDCMGVQENLDKSQDLSEHQIDDDEDTTCEYTDDDLDEALAEEADVEDGKTKETLQIQNDITDDKEISKIYENEPMCLQENLQNFDESHYLPMTPKKIESDLSGTLALVSLLDSNNEEEENHYVEMTKQLQEEDTRNNYEVMCINHAANNPVSHEYGCKLKQSKVNNEPLYMELQAGKQCQNTLKAKEETPLQLGKTSTLKKSKKSNESLKKKSKKSQQERHQNKRKDLPDILKPSQNSMVLNTDSSDADDESSKYVDAKKMRSRSRFSLSDTFRPASYYLGTSTPLNNYVESSDSEIVSPPPIPNSPPPMEELKTEEIFSAEHYDTVKRKDSSSCSKINVSYEQLPEIHASNASLNFSKSEVVLKSSRLSLPDQFVKVKNLKIPPHLLLQKQHERTMSDSNYSFQTDNSSNTSSDYDLYNKLKKSSPSYIATPIRYQSNSSLTFNQRKTSLPGTGNNSETDTVELRQRQGSDSELERQRSRRPLSEESISEIESLSEKFEDALETADLDTYLNDLQNSDLYLYQNTKFDSSTTTILSDAVAAQGAGILTNLIKPPKIFRNQDDEHSYASISVRNVRNLPKGNLTVKPDPSDPQLQQQRHLLQQKYNYDQMQKLENSYYGTAHDMKYAKTTLLTDRNTNAVGNEAISETLLIGGGTYATSTPLHRSGNSNDSVGVLGHDYYGTNGYVSDVHNGYQQQQHLQQLQQQQHQLLSHPIRRVSSRAEIDMLERETSSQIRNLDVSAGDLLSRTHEELVLLLIQLRRQNSNTARAIEQCCSDIHDVQNRLRTAEGLTRAESIQRLDYLKQHLLDLERQYEKSKPLVNLVDNMVKLGSLYRNDVGGRTQRPEAVALDRLEFNQRIQEKRLLQEEQKQWDRLNPDHSELQSKVRQLYHLDQLLQEESGTLQNLQRDKEDLERALGGLKARIQDTSGPPLALEAAKKQQVMLERELSRVHQLLAENSKKLEQTVAGNARLEQELLVLRQKLQASRESENVLQISDTYTSNTTAMLESELKRVQTLVGDMQRQRQELSSAVKQLTENSSRLYQEIGNKEHGSLRNGETGSNNGSIKKRTNSGCWIETDLDTMMCVNRTVNGSTMNLSTPLYVDTTSSNNASGNFLPCSSTSSKLSDFNTGDSMSNETQRKASSSTYRYNDTSDNVETSGVDSDGFLETNPFANLTQQEKQEIKTVRIVKRESERRHRDRTERSGLSNSTQNLDQVAEEEQYSLNVGSSANGMAGNYHHGKEYQSTERSKSLPRTYTETPKPSSRHHHRHKHGSSSHQNSTSTSLSSAIPNSNDYYGHSGAFNAYDKNSNYFSHHHQQQQQQHQYSQHNRPQQQQHSQHNHQHQLTNGHSNKSPAREHLNPLANAYFAKQMQQQKQQNSHNHHNHPNNISSHSRHYSQGALRQKADSVQSLNKSLSDLTPLFQSEAAKQIMNEMSAGSASEDTEKVPTQHKHRRAVPKEKRRHYTAPNNLVPVKIIESGQTENDMNRNNTNWRARDDLDMEVALRPRMNAPDVVRSALRHGEKISENTIDNLLLAPNKIVIPERYIPETTPELSPEEKKRRQEKVESIKKMLAEAPISAANETTATLPPSKINEEKKQREHLLQLNQILAQQVMQMSKIVAEKAMSKVGNGTAHDDDYNDGDDDDYSPNGIGDDERKSESPIQPLPIYQQRNNYYS